MSPDFAVGPPRHTRTRGAVAQAYADTGALTVACSGGGAAVDAYCVFEDGRQKHIACAVRLRAAQKKQETK